MKITISRIYMKIMLIMITYSTIISLTITYAQSSSIDVTFPTRAQPNKEQDNTNLQHRLDILPYEEDKEAEGYIVFPKQGVIAPLVWPNSDDIEKIKNGELFDHYKYLQNGALHYIGTAPDQGIGNMVIAAHSSFATSDPGRYKTIFQGLISTSIGDKIFVYLQNEAGDYDTYIYTVEESKEIAETDVSILDQQVTHKTLTTFTCYPIGTTDARWKNVAVLTETIFATSMAKNKESSLIDKEKTHDAAPEKPATEKTSFKTQSVVQTAPQKITKKLADYYKKNKTNSPISTNFTNSTQNLQTSSGLNLQTSSIPLLLRVKYRPLAYKSTLQLLAKSGFKKTTLTKLIMILEEKKSLLSTSDTTGKKSYIHYSLMQEIIMNFMY